MPGQPCAADTRGARRKLLSLAAALSLLVFVPGALVPPPAWAGEADVIEVVLSALGDGRYRVDATVRHDDTGWDHYANRWDVFAPDGTLLGSRELLHPHENEQPFTRSLTLTIPANIERVTVRAFDSVHDGGGASVEVEVPR